MTRMTLFGLLVAGLALGTAQATRAEDKPEGGPLKVVVHVNVSEPGLQGAGLKNVTNILKEAPDSLVEVVCHGAGIGLVEKARTDHAEAVETLIKRGVKFVACENTMRQKSIRKEDLLPGVGTVPSGAVEVVRRQLFAPLLLMTPAVAQLPSAKPVPRVQVLPLPDFQASFLLDGRELTRFRFDPAKKRPFWHPVQTTLAPSLVRMGHPHDPVTHRHHYGVWMTHSSVSGVNFWDDEADNGKEKVRGSIRHQRTIGFWDGDESAAMMTLNHWVAERDNKVLLIEKRHTELRPVPDATSWLLIVDSEFTAPKGQSASFEPSGFGLMSARMAKTIGVHDGGGRILNSEGQISEKEVFRKPAKWCDYSGRVTNEAFAGITLMNHPGNPNHPTAFHVRDDGWMCCCLSLEKPIEVKDTQPLHVRHALWVHEGVRSAEEGEAMWQRFAEMPLPDMNKKP